MSQAKPPRAKAKGPFCCYALENGRTNKSYTGQTNNFERRIRQHNGELKGGARYTHSVQGGQWTPIYRVCGFQTLRAVLQYEIAAKRRKVPVRFGGGIKKVWTRGPVGRVVQLEYLLSLGRLNAEAHSHFASNGIRVELDISLERYLKMARLTRAQFDARRQSQGIPFLFKS